MKIYIALIVFLSSSQIAFDLMYASGRLSPIIYSQDTYYSSAFINAILAVIGFVFILNEDVK